MNIWKRNVEYRNHKSVINTYKILMMILRKIKIQPLVFYSIEAYLFRSVHFRFRSQVKPIYRIYMGNGGSIRHFLRVPDFTCYEIRQKWNIVNVSGMKLLCRRLIIFQPITLFLRTQRRRPIVIISLFHWGVFWKCTYPRSTSSGIFMWNPPCQVQSVELCSFCFFSISNMEVPFEEFLYSIICTMEHSLEKERLLRWPLQI